MRDSSMGVMLADFTVGVLMSFVQPVVVAWSCGHCESLRFIMWML